MHAADTLILGLGLTGLSCVRFLRTQGVEVAVWDTRMQPPGADTLATEFPEVRLLTGPFDADALKRARSLVVSPGIPLATPAIAEAMEAGVEAIGDIELFARHVDAPVLAITGSNGKSTVTSWVGAMAEAAQWSVGVGGNIGTPALDLLGQGHRLYILELSSFQLETTDSLDAIAATVLNVSPDHLDRYTGFDAYRDAKLKLYDQAQLCITNRADPHTQAPEERASLSFGLDAPVGQDYGVRDGQLVQGDTPLLDSNELAMVGSHNLANALAASALARAAGLPQEAINQALRTYRGLAHRCELVAEKGGVRYINDSKATNVGATQAAIDGLCDLPGRLLLIAGGDAKGADLTELAPTLAKVDQLITLGQDGPALAALKPGAEQVATLQSAVALAASEARPGDLVLLSPACASLDMFRNFVERGEQFAAAVEAL
ncbi:UDP-N-acetylmuramoyl-L-alanine--D-glutamate ligase [Ferrimonas marina]|uniref:UDP-N-acetylmuramoylalanine--D-glutamate ligase n=1 Tax=Ferrimonas marina TaxID=299255 RepID=A0A1M5XFZ4_9GAMM|nr:UDP-N-acetylmuramoyl-L-alanine--D-glutamate ligase [Ferrimonas marina]SHH98659.1 UDP-N-acetylmuramoylalanine--D-glutamate ligase [Ferrimonas marina]